MKHAHVIWLIIAAALGVQPVAVQAVELQLAGAEQFSLNEPIVVRLSFANPSEESTYFHTNQEGSRSTKIRVVTSDGKVSLIGYDDLERDCLECLEAAAPNPLAGGETYAVRLVLNRWYPFGERGCYEVSALLERAAVVDLFEDESKVVIGENGIRGVHLSEEDAHWLAQPVASSNSIRVCIGPRDEERLARRARQIVDSVLARGNPQEAVALAYMVDPVAIPHLEVLVQQGGPIGQEAVQGLRRIGSSAAVDALDRSIGRSEPHMDMVIAGILRTIADGTTSDDVRERAQSVLRDRAAAFSESAEMIGEVHDASAPKPGPVPRWRSVPASPPAQPRRPVHGRDERSRADG